MEQYDVIQVGAGHNGLIVAAYLAKAGLNVCVLEKRDFLGGGVISRENSAPGFKDDQASIVHAAIQSNPLILNDELKLFAKYGLKYLYPDKAACGLFPDGRAISIYQNLDNTLKSIARFSERDAEAYRRFYALTDSLVKVMTTGLFNPPVPPSAMMAVMEQSEEGREIIRATQTSVKAIIDEWFESDEVKIILSKFCVDMAMPFDQIGTGAVFYQFIPLMHRFGMPMCVGGSGGLTLALEKCVKDLGGTIRTNCGVKKYITKGGECKGVITEDGEEILAKKLVCSNLNIMQYPDMIDDTLPEEFTRGIKRLRVSSWLFYKIDFALHNAIDWKAKEANDAFFVYPLPYTKHDEMWEHYQRLDRGFVYADDPLVTCQTVFDPTRAPEGKHTLWVCQFVPSSPRDGGMEKWDEIRDKVADDLLKLLRDKSTNMGDENIIGKNITSPLDFKRMNAAWVLGDPMHFGQFSDQVMQSRPLPGWYNFRSPIKNLYMCGASCYPNGNVTGGGRITAMTIFEDLGIDFEKLIQ